MGVRDLEWQIHIIPQYAKIIVKVACDLGEATSESASPLPAYIVSRLKHLSGHTVTRG